MLCCIVKLEVHMNDVKSFSTKLYDTSLVVRLFKMQNYMTFGDSICHLNNYLIDERIVGVS